MAKKNTTHAWTIEDENYLINEIVRCWNREDWSELNKRIANHIGTSVASVSAKIQNHKYTLGLSSKFSNTSALGDQAIIAANERLGFTKSKWDMILK